MTTQSEAFAVQAAADLDAYNLLAGSRLPSSQRLHFLQMWLEKLCKAYLWLPEAAADELRIKHNVVAKVLPRLIGKCWQRIGLTHEPDISSIRQICREIDLLHPQVDDNGRRPDNVEIRGLGYLAALKFRPSGSSRLRGSCIRIRGGYCSRLQSASRATRPYSFLPNRKLGRAAAPSLALHSYMQKVALQGSKRTIDRVLPSA